jgi:SsrA-binding protein
MKIKNKKAFFNYNISNSFEAGIVLTGAEVKSIRSGRANLGDAYVKVLNDELWLINAEIPKYKYDSDEFYDPRRTRKLLVKRREITQISSKIKQGRLTLIPVSMYIVRGKVKVEVGYGKGKRDYEKREVQKKRDLDRELLHESKKYMV